jgi:hypothetical protein
MSILPKQTTRKIVFLKDKGRVLEYPPDMSAEEINFDIKNRIYGQSKADYILSNEPLSEKTSNRLLERIASNPVISKALDYAEQIMPREDWEQMQAEELQGLRGLRQLAETITDPTAILKMTPEQKWGALRGISYLFKPLRRLAEPVRAGIIAAIKRKEPPEIRKVMIRGFFMPDEVPTGISQIPLGEFPLVGKRELEGAWGWLIPRASAEAIEHFLLYQLVFGVPNQISALTKTEGVKSQISKIEKVIPLFEKHGVRFPADMSDYDKAVAILHAGRVNPQVGDSLKIILSQPTEFYAGLPAKLKIGDLVRIGKETGKILSISGSEAVVGVAGKEITKTLSELQPAIPVTERVKPEIKPPKEEVYKPIKFSIGQEVEDIVGDRGIVKDSFIDPDTDIRFYQVEFPEGTAQMSEGTLKAVEEPSLITPKQIAYIHMLKKKKMLTERQYRHLMKIYTGKKTLKVTTPTGKLKKKPMTKKEAEKFISAIKRIVPKELGEGAVISRKKTLVPAGFFEKLPPEAIARGIRPGPAEGEPIGILSRFMPTIRVMKQAGAYEQVYRPMKLAFWKRMIEEKQLRELEREVFGNLKDDSLEDVAMFEYLENKVSAESEKILTPELKQKADLIKEKFKDFLKRINKARTRLHKKPIQPRQNYAPHIFDAVTQQTLREKFPLSNETYGALHDFVISTKTTGRFLQRREGAENYRKSLYAAWRAYKNMALDIIHYAEPTYLAKSYIKYYPPTTQRYLKAFLNEGMFNKAGTIQEEIKQSFKPVEKLFEQYPEIKALRDPSRSLAKAGRALMHIGGIGLNYTTVIKNATQSVLTYNLVNSEDTAKTIELMTTDIRKFFRIANTNPMTLGRFPFEIREVDLMQILRATMIPYRMVDVFNISFAYNAGLIHELQPLAKQRGISIDKLLDEYLAKYGTDTLAGNFQQVLLDMETGLGFGKQIEAAIVTTGEMSQWSYYKQDMPRIFWSEPTASLSIFQSWPLYKTLHHYPELFNRLFHGKDFLGREVSTEQRAGILKDLILMALVAAGLSKLGIDIWRTWGPGTITIPFINSPYVKLLQGFSQITAGLFASKEKTRKWLINEGMRDIKQTLWLFVPAGVAIRREIKRQKKGIRRDRILRKRKIRKPIRRTRRR